MVEEEREKSERVSEAEVCGGTVEMDITPERNQIRTPVSKFEDSPVFNFIDSLSPIKPFKSMHTTQSFSSLSFASIPSVFTSPHISAQKEPRFLRRHQFPDPSKPEFSSENGNKDEKDEGILGISHSGDQNEKFDRGCSVKLSYECSKQEIDPKHVSESATGPPPLVAYEQVSDKGLFETDQNSDGINEIGQNEGPTACDWDCLISETGDLLLFDSPNETVDPGMFCDSISSDDLEQHQVIGSDEQYEMENVSTQPGQESEVKETAGTEQIGAGTSVGNCRAERPSEKMDNETVSNLYRGMRRRCLVFETVGALNRHAIENICNKSPILSQSNGNIGSGNKQLVPFKHGNNSSSRGILPGIGLHLNALAASSNNCKVVHHSPLAPSRRQLPSSSKTSFHSLASGQEKINESMALVPLEGNMGPAEIGPPLQEHASEYMANEEFSNSSPRKKRRRLENARETEGCKRCNCKKSRCLKLYCECFAAGIYCVEPCACQNCFNKPLNEATVLSTRKQIESRNPLAFAPKVIRAPESSEIGHVDSRKTPASDRHKRGCNCKKSGCLKKYCECYQSGVGCSINCRCEGCKNAFGRKDGSSIISIEAEVEDVESETTERNVLNRKSKKKVAQTDPPHNSEPAVLATPINVTTRTMIHQTSVPSKGGKPPRSIFSIGSSSGFYSGQRLGKSNLFQPPPNFEKHFQMAHEEMPEILHQSRTPVAGVKVTSPNSKRVSPPHSDLSHSPGRQSSRKLILQSIPAFPSLTPNPKQ